MIESAVTDLPLPDSPTRHSVSPALSSKLTSITAGTNRPRTSKPVVRFATESSRDSRFAVRDSPRESVRGSEEFSEPRTANCEPRDSDINLLVLAQHATQR